MYGKPVDNLPISEVWNSFLSSFYFSILWSLECCPLIKGSQFRIKSIQVLLLPWAASSSSHRMLLAPRHIKDCVFIFLFALRSVLVWFKIALCFLQMLLFLTSIKPSSRRLVPLAKSLHRWKLSLVLKFESLRIRKMLCNFLIDTSTPHFIFSFHYDWKNPPSK